MLNTELENTRQERDMLREELHCSHLALENLRAELAVRPKTIFYLFDFFGLSTNILRMTTSVEVKKNNKTDLWVEMLSRIQCAVVEAGF